jgi:hypothetical protein
MSVRLVRRESRRSYESRLVAVRRGRRRLTSVSTPFGFQITDADGNSVVDFQARQPAGSDLTDTSWPDGFTATVEMIITSAH